MTMGLDKVRIYCTNVTRHNYQNCWLFQNDWESSLFRLWFLRVLRWLAFGLHPSRITRVLQLDRV